MKLRVKRGNKNEKQRIEVDAHIYNFQIRVLLYREGDECVAHALEMDLMGYGSTEKSAIKELSSLIESQITFARQKKDESLLLFQAEKDYFERWEKAHSAALRHEVLQDVSAKMDVKAICISLDKQLNRLHPTAVKRFAPVDLTCA